jgi:hypothetical protein
LLHDRSLVRRNGRVSSCSDIQSEGPSLAYDVSPALKDPLVLDRDGHDDDVGCPALEHGVENDLEDAELDTRIIRGVQPRPSRFSSDRTLDAL